MVRVTHQVVRHAPASTWTPEPVAEDSSSPAPDTDLSAELQTVAAALSGERMSPRTVQQALRNHRLWTQRRGNRNARFILSHFEVGVMEATEDHRTKGRATGRVTRPA